MKNEMLNRLWNLMGTNDTYFTLMSLDADTARRMEDAYTADYEAAPEREDETVDVFAAAMDPNYQTSKSQLIGAWAVEIKRAIVKAYINQFSAEELDTMRGLLTRGGVEAEITICQGVTISWRELAKEG